ncbi:hypothetical protein EBR03_01930 [bacterium]|nr:hypothetical protein [bacterium]
MVLFYPVARCAIENKSSMAGESSRAPCQNHFSGMLKTAHWQTVLNTSKNLHEDPYEFFAEMGSQQHFVFESKKSRLRNFESGGLQLVISRKNRPETFQSSCLDPDSFLQFFQEASVQSTQNEKSKPFLALRNNAEQFKRLEQACRRTLLETSAIQDLKVHYQETQRTYLYGTDRSALTEGHENFAQISAQLLLKNETSQRTLTFAQGRTDIDSLMSELEKNWFTKKQIEKALSKPWPCPLGKIPVLWSSKVVAQLALYSLYQLEYFSRSPDGFQHYLNQFSRFNFQLIDNWKNTGSVDVEGRPRTETLIFSSQEMPRKFDQTLAGFSRRASYKEFPITAPWEPAILGNQRTQNLLGQLENGISVHEIDVLSFDIKTGKAQISIREAALIHQGLEGEKIEPSDLWISIPQLLGSFELFSDKSSPHPLSWGGSSAHSGLFVEMTAPEALSSTVDIQGTVPKSYYW